MGAGWWGRWGRPGAGGRVRRWGEAVRTDDVGLDLDMLEARPELINTDLAENDEHRAIHYAVLDRSVEMVRLLMACGADAQQGIHPHPRHRHRAGGPRDPPAGARSGTRTARRSAPTDAAGEGHHLGEQGSRGVLQVGNVGSQVSVPEKESGRRELAEWIASDLNPLTSRVLVNRLWEHVPSRFTENVRTVRAFFLSPEKHQRFPG